MNRDDVDRLYKIWMFHRTRLDCECPDHHPRRKNVCARETAWRNYVEARDKLLGPRKESKAKTVDVDSLLDAFDGDTEH